MSTYDHEGFVYHAVKWPGTLHKPQPWTLICYYNRTPLLNCNWRPPTLDMMLLLLLVKVVDTIFYLGTLSKVAE